MKILIALLFGVALGLVVTPAFAADKKLNKDEVRVIMQNCFQLEVNLFENHNQRLPNADEADLLMTSCLEKVNQ